MSDKTVIFDLDGTLLDTLDDLTDAVNHALAAKGFPPRTREEVRRFVGNGVAALIRRALPAGTDDRTVADTLANFKTYYAAHCRVKTAPYPGVPELLEHLKEQGYRIAVSSNKFDAAVQELCEHYFGGRVDVAVGENEAAGVRRKPEPDTICEALRRLGATEATMADALASTIYIGDSETDLATAKNASLPAISVTWGFRDEPELLTAGATRIAHTTRELEALLLDL